MAGTIPDAAEQPKAVVLAETTIRITQDAIQVTKGGDLSFTRGPKADPTLAHLLLYDATVGAYRPVLTPAGTSWSLEEKRQGPGLWQPGMPT